jgi:3-oxoacyl-[acyl-carrier protein] reductase
MFHVKHIHGETAMFENKTVVVTGAGRGIGRTLALGFAQQGASVLVHYAHAAEGAHAVVRQITEQGGRAELAQADLRKSEDIARLVHTAHAMLREIDVWINNAGASANSRETSGMDEIAIFDRMMEVDVRGTWLCCRMAADYMRAGGCILTTGWDGALAGSPGLPAQLYAMSKGAIISLTHSLASEFAPRLRVNCIAPGHVENEWSHSLPAASRQKFVQKIPMQRWGTAEDILGAALFLASPAASFITGQVILVNGGEIMH